MAIDFGLPDLPTSQSSTSPAQPKPEITYQGNPLDDPNFKDDLRRHFWGKGRQFDNDDDMVKAWYQERTAANLNSLGMIKDTADAFASNEQERARAKRLQDAYDKMPMFFEDGGAIDRVGGWETAGAIAGSLILDPINLIPFGKAAVAAKMARMGGATTKQAVMAGVRSGALTQGAVEAGVAGGMSALQQTRDQRLGLQDEFSVAEMGTQAALSGVLGAGIGGLIGGLASRTGIKVADDAMEGMINLGMTPEQILDMPRDKLQAIIGGDHGPVNRAALNDYMRDQRLGVYAEQDAYTRPAQPSTDFTMVNEPELTEAERVAATFDEDIAGINDDLAELHPDDPEYERLIALRNSRLSGKIILGERDRLQSEAEAAIAAGKDKEANELLTRVANAERELRRIQDGAWDDPALKAEAEAVTDELPEGEVKAEGEAQAQAEAELPKDRRTSFTADMKAALQAMPEFGDADINGVKDAQKLIRRVAKGKLGITDADDLSTDDLFNRIMGQASTAKVNNQQMASQALDDFLEEVSLDGQHSEANLNRFLGERDTYAANKEGILKVYRDSVKTEAESKDLIAKMLDDDGEEISPDELATGSEDDLLDEIDQERALKRGQGADDRATARTAADAMRQGYESDKVMGELRNELYLVVQEARRLGVAVDDQTLKAWGRQANNELSKVETRNAMVNLVGQRGGNPLLDDALRSQWLVGFVRKQIEGHVLKNADGRKNIRGNTDALERQSIYATDELTAKQAQAAASLERRRKRLENMRSLPNMEVAKATALSSKQPTEFVADTRVQYLNSRGELTQARRGDKLFAVLHPDRAGQVTYVDKPETVAILMGRKPDVTAHNIAKATMEEGKSPVGPTFDSDVKDAPSGYRLALVSKAATQGQHTVRRVSNVQLQSVNAGKRTMTARNLLGKANPDEWDAVWLPDSAVFKGNQMTPSQRASLPWQPERTGLPPKQKMEYLVGSQTDTWANARTKRFPVAADWQAKFFAPTGDATMDRALNDVQQTLLERELIGPEDMTVEGLYYSRIALENTVSWADPKTTGLLLDKVDNLLGMEEKVYPRGLQLPNGERVAQMRKLNELMADYDHKTSQVVWDTLNRVAIAHPEGKVPVFGQSDKPRYRGYSQSDNFNDIGLPTTQDMGKRPRPYALMHELMHWSYNNILTPSERRQFVTAVKGHMDAGTIGDLLPTTDTGLASNLTSGLNEIFAEAGASWAMNNRAPALLDQSFWVALADKVRAVYNHILSRGNGGIKEDPALNELFARILPDNEQIRQRLGLPDNKVFDNAEALIQQLDRVKFSGAKGSLEVRLKVLADLEEADKVIDDLALDPDQWPAHVGEDSMLSTLIKGSRSAFSYTGKDGKGIYQLRYAKNSQGRADAILSELGTLRDSPTPLEETGTITAETYKAYVKKTGNADPALFMRDVLFNPRHPSSVPYALAVMKQGLRDAILGQNGLWVGRDAMPTANTAWEYALAQKQRHAVKPQKTVAETVAAVPEESPSLEALSKQAEAILEREQPLPTQATADEAALVEQAKAALIKSEPAQQVIKATVRKAGRKQAAEANKIAEATTTAKSLTEKKPRTEVEPAPAQVAESAPSPKSVPTQKLADKVVEVKEKAPTIEHTAVADEMIRRARMTKSMVGKKRVEVTWGQYRATRSELRDSYIEALKQADEPTLAQIEWVFQQRAAAKTAGAKAGLGRSMLGSEILDGQVYLALKPKLSGKAPTKAVARELADSRGVAAESGVMPSAPANIRALQTELTHRDPQTAHDMRTVFYRMLALADKVTRNLPATTLDNLFVGSPMSHGALADATSESFKATRDTLRRSLTALRKDGDFEPAITNIGHMVARAINGSVDAGAVNKVFKATGGSGSVTDWFINQWRVVASGQKGLNALTEGVDVFTAGKFSDAVSEFGESMAYVLRGAIDREDIYQRYRWLGAYGDPLQPDTVRTLATMSKDGVGDAVAQLHAYDYLDSLDIHQKVGMARWVGGPVRPFYVKTSEAAGARGGPLGRAFYVTDRPNTLGLDPAEEFSSLAPEVAEVATEYAHALGGVRDAIAGHRRSMELIEPNDVDGLDRAGETLTNLLESEAGWLMRFDALGVRAPSVQVLVSRAKHTVDLSADAQVSGNGPLVAGILDMAERLGVSNDAISNLADVIVRDQSGPEFVAAMEAWIAKQPSLRSRNGEVLKEFLSGMGFDSAMIGRGDDTRLAVFNPSDIRAMMDDFEPQAAVNRFDVEGNPMRHANAALVNGEAPAIPEIVAAMEDQGLSRRAADAVMAAARGRKMTKGDEQALKPFQFKELFSELSIYMRANKAKWVGDWIKPEEGTGFFERQDSEMGAQLMPVIEQLKKLEGNETFFGRALNAVVPNRKQPASFTRVVQALRYGNSQGLKPEEVKTFTMIRDSFAREWQSLVDAQLAGQDAGIRNYFPQVWDVEKLEANQDEFVNRLANYFTDSHRAETGEVLPTADALYKAQGVFDNLVGNDGVYSPASLLKGTASEHVDATRVLRLHEHPGHMGPDGVGAFLQDDLEGVMVKYFQGTTRRRLFHEQFGQGNHAFHDYMDVLSGGDNAAFELLTSGKVKTQQVVGANDPIKAEVQFSIFRPLFNERSEAWQALDEVKTIIKRDGKENAVRYLQQRDASPDMGRRIRAVVEALAETDGKRNQVPENVRKNIVSMFESIEGKNPFRHAPGFKWKNPVSHALRSFNSITLLGSTILSSMSDTMMPLVNSGDFKAYVKGLTLYARDPEYRVMMRNVGVAMENLVHSRMANLYGQDAGKLTNAFFNATLLTPWTDMWRGIAGSVAMETFKAEQRRALSGRTGEAGRKHAVQFLRRYGLAGYVQAGDLASADAMNDPLVRRAILRFTNESIFSPNPNDVPLWAKSPVGAMIYQFKTFPMMMGRAGLRTARSGRLGSQVAFLTALPLAGAASLAVKDVLLARGGEDQRSMELREREPQEWVVQSVLQAGALGILADVLSATTEQLDNGAYGRERIASTFLGPSFGVANDALKMGAGLFDTEPSNSKEREAVRTLLGRVPVVGRNANLREGIVDETAGAKQSQGGTGYEDKYKSKFDTKF